MSESAQQNPFPMEPDLVAAVLDWIELRISKGSDPTHGAKTLKQLAPALNNTITPQGIGSAAAFGLFTDIIVPSVRPFDHPSSLSFGTVAQVLYMQKTKPWPGSLSWLVGLRRQEAYSSRVAPWVI